MRLDVRSRIAIAMTVVMAVNIAAGVLTWHFHEAASESSLRARQAAARSEWVATIAARATVFMNQAGHLAFSFNDALSEEASVEYGKLIGADPAATRVVDKVPAGLTQEDAERVSRAWNELRTGVFVWVNAEAEGAGGPARLRMTDQGAVRAGIESNIATPAALEALDRTELRRTVRMQAEAFTGGLLRTIGNEAAGAAESAARKELEARERAMIASVGLIGGSLFAAILAAAWLYSTIAGPLRAARRTAEAVTAGDLDAQFSSHGDDEIGVLIRAVEEMRDTVVRKVETMREMAGAVLVTAEDVAMGVADAAGSITDDESANPLAAREQLAEAAHKVEVLQGLSAQMLEE